MEDLIVFMTSFFIIFVVYLVIYFIKRKKKTLKDMKEFDILASQFHLNRKSMNENRLALIFVLINSLIISSVGTMCTMVETNAIWQLLIGFALLMALIIISYTIIGYILKKKEGIKNERKRNRK